MLPRVAFGANPGGHDGIPPEAPGIILLHHFKGTWKDDNSPLPSWLLPKRWIRWKIVKRRLRALAAALPPLPWHPALGPSPASLVCSALGRLLSALAAARKLRQPPQCAGGSWWSQALPEAGGEARGPGGGWWGQERHSFSVSVDAQPPFELLVEAAGTDRPAARAWPTADPSAEACAWGMSHPGQLPWRRPAVPHVVTAALLHGRSSSSSSGSGGFAAAGGRSSLEKQKEKETRSGGVLVVIDVGAGLGLQALALATASFAANVPLSVHAVEPSPRRAELLRRAARRNGLPAGRLSVHMAAAAAVSSPPAAATGGGGEEGPGWWCWQDASLVRPAADSRRTSTPTGEGRLGKGGGISKLPLPTDGGGGRNLSGSGGDHDGRGERRERGLQPAETARGGEEEEGQRGGGGPPLASEAPPCAASDRVPLLKVDDLWRQIEARESGVGSAPLRPALLRVSAGAAALAVLHGARRLLRWAAGPPALLQLELLPAAPPRAGAAPGPEQLAQALSGLLPPSAPSSTRRRPHYYAWGFHAGAGCDRRLDAAAVPRCTGRHCGGAPSADESERAPQAQRQHIGDRLQQEFEHRAEVSRAAWASRGRGPCQEQRPGWRRLRLLRRLMSLRGGATTAADCAPEGGARRRRRLAKVFGVEDGDDTPHPSGEAAGALRAPWEARWCAVEPLTAAGVAAALEYSVGLGLPETFLFVLKGNGSSIVDPQWLDEMQRDAWRPPGAD